MVLEQLNTHAKEMKLDTDLTQVLTKNESEI